jgi:hypothetical protein
MDGSYFGSAGVLWVIARDAYRRTQSAPSDLTPGQNDALVAVLFSAACLEALIMEVALFSGADADLTGNPGMGCIASLLEEAEAAKTPVQFKYMLFRAMMRGEMYDRGAQPYQDLDTLFAIRNAIVHLKPERITEDPHKLVKRIKAKGLCENDPSGSRWSWTAQISTRAVARWACNVVADIVDSIREAIPEKAVSPVVAFWVGCGKYRVT